MIKEDFFFFLEELEDDEDDEGDDGGDGGEGISPFPLPSIGATITGSSTPLIGLGVEVLSPQPFLNSKYISSTMACMAIKLSMN